MAVNTCHNLNLWLLLTHCTSPCCAWKPGHRPIAMHVATGGGHGKTTTPCSRSYHRFPNCPSASTRHRSCQHRQAARPNRVSAHGSRPGQASRDAYRFGAANVCGAAAAAIDGGREVRVQRGAFLDRQWHAISRRTNLHRRQSDKWRETWVSLIW